MILTVTPNPCVDKTLYVDKLEPGETHRASRYGTVAGGKGTNVSRAVRQLGRDTRALVVVGGDTGRHVVRMLEDEGTPCLPVEVDSPTRTITTVLEEPQHRQTPLFEPGSSLTEEDLRSIRNTFEEAVQDAKVVTFSGTVSDPIAASLYRDLIPIAHDAGALTILDSHGAEMKLGLESKPTALKPNLLEAEELLGRSLANLDELLESLSAFHDMGIDLAMLSLGSDGALLSRGGERIHVTPPIIDEVNAVGSGDAFVAGIAIGLLEDMQLADMARLAVAAGTANAMSWEIGHFTAGEVQEIQARVNVQGV